MKVTEAIKIAVETQNAAMAGNCADILRFKCGMNYNNIYEFAKQCVPSLTLPQWETLMEEAYSTVDAL